MATPDSLTTWRDFLAQRPATRPSRSSGRSSSDKAAYDRDRLAYLAADITLQTRDITEVDNQVRRMSARLETRATLRSSAIAVSGMPSTGKTTAALAIARNHERRVHAAAPHWHPQWQASIYVVTPPATTPKMLMQAFCRFLGTPYRSRDTAVELADRVVHVLRELRTSLVVLDELHNLQSNRQVGAEAASTLKLFAERLDAVFLYAGVDLQNNATFTGPVGQQLASRMLHWQMLPYAIRTKQDRDIWRGLLLDCESLLGLERQRPGDILIHDLYLFDRTGGSIGTLRSLLREAATVAIESGHERLDRPMLDAVPLGSGAQVQPAPRPRPTRRSA